MAEAITVARPYAEAIYKCAVNKNALNDWSLMLESASSLAEDKQIKSLIGNPVVSAKQLGELLIEAGKKTFNEEGRNLLTLLAENNRVDVLPYIKQLFEQLKAQHEGVLEAKIVTAFEINNNQLRKLVSDLEKKFKSKIEAKVSVDPELIGGVKVEIGDEVLDTSVRAKLETMAVSLKS